MPLKSYLDKLQHQSPMTAKDLLKKQKQAWQDKGTILITQAQMQTLGGEDYEVMTRVAIKLFGARFDKKDKNAI